MPRASQQGNVLKICGCKKWRTCRHPFYLNFKRGTLRVRRRLDAVVGRPITDYQEAKDEARRAIGALLDGHDPKTLQAADAPTLTELLAEYGREHPIAVRWQIPKILKTPVLGPGGARPFGEWQVSAITAANLRQFQQVRPRASGNRDLALLRHAFRMAVVGGLVAQSPFRVGDVPVVKLAREHSRTRRLHPGEEAQLLAHGASVRDLIVAALETGCRLGELLSMQWHQVRFTPRAEIFLPATKTKAKKDRRVPISSVLWPILTRRRMDPAGEELGQDTYVFGDEVGRRRASIKRAWNATVLRAHGHKPTYTTRPVKDKKARKTTAKLTPASRALLREIDLHFHDLRREAGSRWMDAGVPLGTIQRWLGHYNISQTSTYLGASLGGDDVDMRGYEERVGRVPGLSQIVISGGQNGDKRSDSDLEGHENPNKNGSVAI